MFGVRIVRASFDFHTAPTTINYVTSFGELFVFNQMYRTMTYESLWFKSEELILSSKFCAELCFLLHIATRWSTCISDFVVPSTICCHSSF